MHDLKQNTKFTRSKIKINYDNIHVPWLIHFRQWRKRLEDKMWTQMIRELEIGARTMKSRSWDRLTLAATYSNAILENTDSEYGFG